MTDDKNSDGGNAKMAQQDVERKPRPEVQRRAELVTQILMKESDRGCAIFGASLLHTDLELLLKAYCRSDGKLGTDALFATYAPLSTFSACIQIGYAFGLVPSHIKARLEIVRKLRNDFAHDAGPISFESPHCRDRLALLIGRDSKDPVPGHEEFIEQVGMTRRELTNRLAFILAVSFMSQELDSIAKTISEGRDHRLLVKLIEQQFQKGNCEQ